MKWVLHGGSCSPVDAVSSRIIAITGIDGSGKTTLVDWLKTELVRRGHAPGFVWSRFNNYFSLPFLAIARLTGHNYYEVNEGVRMGYHDFRGFPGILKAIFVAAQAIDVNIATLLKINVPSRKYPLTLCERGPWDTLVDVYADTGLEALLDKPYPGLFTGQLAGMNDVILIDRDPERIEESRAELRHDRSLRQRYHAYRRLANSQGWTVLDNNRTIDETKADLSAWLDAAGY